MDLVAQRHGKALSADQEAKHESIPEKCSVVQDMGTQTETGGGKEACGLM